MHSSFGADEVRCAAEDAFGVQFAVFKPLGAGNSSRNFHAVTAGGDEYFIKVANADRTRRISAYLAKLSSPLIPGLAFGGKRGHIGRYEITAFAWVRGGYNIAPHHLTKPQIAAILEGYETLSEAFSAVDAGLLEKWSGADAAAAAAGLPLRPIHGDFHFRNYFLRGDKLIACCDFECMRLGIATEDLARIFIHAMERTHFWHLPHQIALHRNFARMVAMSRYPESAWRAAVDQYISYKSERRRAKRANDFFARVEGLLRAPLYAAFRRRCVKKSPPAQA